MDINFHLRELIRNLIAMRLNHNPIGIDSLIVTIDYLRGRDLLYLNPNETEASLDFIGLSTASVDGIRMRIRDTVNAINILIRNNQCDAELANIITQFSDGNRLLLGIDTTEVDQVMAVAPEEVPEEVPEEDIGYMSPPSSSSKSDSGSSDSPSPSGAEGGVER